ncbi:hypothetical protein JI58_00315 [Marinosulfonomonas sp. PRT-SC04]|nr:hypothetical protein JI58_00315 [Marinosulfonomonas sp. PRT-SC04]
MTLLYKEYPDLKTIEIHVDGKVSQAEFDTAITGMDAFIQTHGTVKFLETIVSFKVGMDVSMFWEGLKFDMKNISHCAVVSDIGWISPMSKAAGAFMSTKLRTFNMGEIDAARAWLKDPDANAAPV